MSRTPDTGMPKHPDGKYDKEAIHAMFMASKYLDWTRFAEDQGWDPLLSRREFPVKTWIKEKRDHLAERKMDILSGLFHERKFQWTEDILKMLDDYPATIDLAMMIAKGKLSQMADLFKDYQDNFRGKEHKMYRTTQAGKRIRQKHMFESLPGGEIGALLSGIKSINDAKLKSLMLDKWAISKFDMAMDNPEDGEEGGRIGPTFTIEGKANLTPSDLQDWFDKYHDKPVLPAGDPAQGVKPENPADGVKDE